MVLVFWWNELKFNLLMAISHENHWQDNVMDSTLHKNFIHLHHFGSLDCFEYILLLSIFILVSENETSLNYCCFWFRYDRSANNEVCFASGQKAHWLLVHGLLQPTATVEAADCPTLLIGSHGLSQHPLLVPVNELLASNAQLSSAQTGPGLLIDSTLGETDAPQTTNLLSMNSKSEMFFLISWMFYEIVETLSPGSMSRSKMNLNINNTILVVAICFLHTVFQSIVIAECMKNNIPYNFQITSIKIQFQFISSINKLWNLIDGWIFNCSFFVHPFPKFCYHNQVFDWRTRWWVSLYGFRTITCTKLSFLMWSNKELSSFSIFPAENIRNLKRFLATTWDKKTENLEIRLVNTTRFRYIFQWYIII